MSPDNYPPSSPAHLTAVKKNLDPSALDLSRSEIARNRRRNDKIFLAPLHTLLDTILQSLNKNYVAKALRGATACAHAVPHLSRFLREKRGFFFIWPRNWPRSRAQHRLNVCERVCVRTSIVEQCIKIGSTLSPQADWIITTAAVIAQTFLNIKFIKLKCVLSFQRRRRECKTDGTSQVHHA